MIIVIVGLVCFSLVRVLSSGYEPRVVLEEEPEVNTDKDSVITVSEKKDITKATDYTNGVVASKYTEVVDGKERYYLFIGGRVYDVDSEVYQMFSEGDTINYKDKDSLDEDA